MFGSDLSRNFRAPYARVRAGVWASVRERASGIWRQIPAGDGARSITVLRLGIIASCAVISWGLVVAALLASL
jgi:hypothetical protein